MPTWVRGLRVDISFAPVGAQRRKGFKSEMVVRADRRPRDTAWMPLVGESWLRNPAVDRGEVRLALRKLVLAAVREPP